MTVKEKGEEKQQQQNEEDRETFAVQSIQLLKLKDKRGGEKRKD